MIKKNNERRMVERIHEKYKDELKYAKDNKQKWAEIIYKNYKDDMRYAKEIQWKIIFYTFLLYGTIYAFFRNNKTLTGIILILIVFIFAILFIWQIQADMTRYRRQAVRIRRMEEFSIIRYLTGDTEQSDKEYSSFKYYISYPINFTILLIIAAFFVCWQLRPMVGCYDYLQQAHYRPGVFSNGQVK